MSEPRSSGRAYQQSVLQANAKQRPLRPVRRAFCLASTLCGLWVTACVLNPQGEDPSLTQSGGVVPVGDVSTPGEEAIANGGAPQPAALAPASPVMTPSEPELPGAAMPGQPVVAPAGPAPAANSPPAAPAPEPERADSGLDFEMSDAGDAGVAAASGEPIEGALVP